MTENKELKPCPFCGEWVDDDFGCKNWMRRINNDK